MRNVLFSRNLTATHAADNGEGVPESEHPFIQMLLDSIERLERGYNESREMEAKAEEKFENHDAAEETQFKNRPV